MGEQCLPPCRVVAKSSWWRGARGSVPGTQWAPSNVCQMTESKVLLNKYFLSVLHLNDQWELPHGRKCQRGSRDGSLGPGLVDSDYVEQNRFGSLSIWCHWNCANEQQKCDFMLGECQDPDLQSKRTLPISSTPSLPPPAMGVSYLWKHFWMFRTIRPQMFERLLQTR